jgi:hypothetical protein
MPASWGHCHENFARQQWPVPPVAAGEFEFHDPPVPPYRLPANCAAPKPGPWRAPQPYRIYSVPARDNAATTTHWQPGSQSQPFQKIDYDLSSADRPMVVTLLFNQRSWYVIGHHSQRKATRCLKLNRFTKIGPTDEGFEIPRDFSVDKHLGNAWRMIRGEKSYEVELDFDADFAETIADTHWQITQDVIWHDDESITFKCVVDGLDEIIWWILGMGPHCVVKKPRELAERVKALAMAVVEKYPKM